MKADTHPDYHFMTVKLADGTTFVRLESPAGAVLVNMDKLRESMAPPVGGYRFKDEDFDRHTSRPGLGYVGVIPVPTPGSWFGGAV